MWPTRDMDSSYQTKKVLQRTIYANYVIARQAVDQGVSIRMPPPSNADTTVLAAIAEGPTVFKPSELKIILEANSSLPGQPIFLSVIAETTSVSLIWTAPSNGGSLITSYTLRWGGSQRLVSGTTAIITGLTPNTSYTFTVLATNAVGSGPASAPFSVTTSAVANLGWTLSTYAGGGTLLYPLSGYCDGSDIYVQYDYPTAVATDGNGNIYVADNENHRIRKINSTGLVTTIAGDGEYGYGTGVGTNARFAFPRGITTDSNGNIYVADRNNNRIRKIDSTGLVTTIAGDGDYDFGDGSGTDAKFRNPSGVATDSSENIYVVDSDNNRIRKIDSTGYVTTIAGDGDYGFADGSGTLAKFNYPTGVETDGNGNIYVADSQNHRIRKIDSMMNVITIAGDGDDGYVTGVGTNAKFYYPNDVTTDGNGNIYVADSQNHRIRKIDSMMNVITIAGGEYGYGTGVGTNAKFNYPTCVATDSSGNIYVADGSNHLIRKIDSTRNVTSTGGACNVPNQIGYGTGVGTNVQFAYPYGITTDSNGNIYVADNDNNRIRKIDSSMNVTTIAGDGTYGYGTGVGTNAKFNEPRGVARDSSGNIYVADRNNNRIRKIDSTGLVTTIAGDGDYDFGDGSGTDAKFRNPSGIATDGNGNIYVADTDNNRIRKIDSTGYVTTIAGNGDDSFADGSGTEAKFAYPNGLTRDSNGNIYVADTENNRIRKIDSSMNVTTIAGSTYGYGTGVGTNARFNYPTGVATDGSGNIYVADSGNNLIRMIDSSMNVTTLVGGGPNRTNRGSINGVGTNAMLNYPKGVTIDSNGNIYVADFSNHTIKKLVFNT